LNGGVHKGEGWCASGPGRNRPGGEREGAGREVEVETAGRMNHTELYI